MRSLFFILTAMFLVGCTSLRDKQAKQPQPDSLTALANITIEGMACQAGCADAIQKNLQILEGINSAEVNYENGEALVVYIPTKTNPDIIQETITNTKVKDYVYSIKNITINTKPLE